jgi:hypothetical protein
MNNRTYALFLIVRFFAINFWLANAMGLQKGLIFTTDACFNITY